MGYEANVKRARRTVSRTVARRQARVTGAPLPRGVNDAAPPRLCWRILREKIRRGDLVLRRAPAPGEAL